MTEGATNSIGGISLELSLDTAQFDAAVEAAEGKLSALGGGSSRRSVPMRGGAAGMADVGGGAAASARVQPVFAINRDTVHGMSVDINRHMRALTAQSGGVKVPVTLGRSNWTQMRAEISRNIGAVPITIQLSGTGKGGGGIAMGDMFAGVVAAVRGTSLPEGRAFLRTGLAERGVAATPRRHGGPVQPGKRYYVGEEGPEEVEFTRPAIIKPYRRFRPATERILQSERDRPGIDYVGNAGVSTYRRGGGVRGYGGKYGSAKPAASNTYPEHLSRLWGDPGAADPGYLYHGASHMNEIRGRYHTDRGTGISPRGRAGDPYSYWATSRIVGPFYSGHTSYGSGSEDAGLVRARPSSQFEESWPGSRPGSPAGEERRSGRRVPRSDLQYWGDDNDWHRFRRGRRRAAGGPVQWPKETLEGWLERMDRDAPVTQKDIMRRKDWDWSRGPMLDGHGKFIKRKMSGGRVNQYRIGPTGEWDEARDVGGMTDRVLDQIANYQTHAGPGGYVGVAPTMHGGNAVQLHAADGTIESWRLFAKKRMQGGGGVKRLPGPDLSLDAKLWPERTQANIHRLSVADLYKLVSPRVKSAARRKGYGYHEDYLSTIRESLLTEGQHNPIDIRMSYDGEWDEHPTVWDGNHRIIASHGDPRIKALYATISGNTRYGDPFLTPKDIGLTKRRAQGGKAKRGGLPRGYSMVFEGRTGEPGHMLGTGYPTASWNPEADRGWGWGSGQVAVSNYGQLKKPTMRGENWPSGFSAVIRDRKGRVVANAPFDTAQEEGRNWLTPRLTWVDPEHRGKGLANAMYVRAERWAGATIRPDWSQTEAGEKLWQQKDRPFGKGVPWPRLQPEMETRRPVAREENGRTVLSLDLNGPWVSSPLPQRQLGGAVHAQHGAVHGKRLPSTWKAYGHDISRSAVRPILRNYEAMADYAQTNYPELSAFAGNIWYPGRRRHLLDEADAAGALPRDRGFGPFLHAARSVIPVAAAASPGYTDATAIAWSRAITRVGADPALLARIKSQADPNAVAALLAGVKRDSIDPDLAAISAMSQPMFGRKLSAGKYGWGGVGKAWRIAQGEDWRAILANSDKVLPFTRNTYGNEQLRTIDSHDFDIAGGGTRLGRRLEETKYGNLGATRAYPKGRPSAARAHVLEAARLSQEYHADVWPTTRRHQAGLWVPHFPITGQPIEASLTGLVVPKGYRNQLPPGFKLGPGGLLEPRMSGGPAFAAVQPDRFHDAISAAAERVLPSGRKVGETVYVYPREEYAGMRTFLHRSNQAGYAIKPDGDFVSVFSLQKGLGKSAVRSGIQRGALKLDAFDEDGFLPGLYGRFGFRETGRDAWNPEYAPPNWHGGTPDVVYMQRQSKAARAIAERQLKLQAKATPGGLRQEGGPVWRRMLGKTFDRTRTMGRRASALYNRRAAGFKRSGLTEYIPGELLEGEAFGEEYLNEVPGPGHKAATRLRQIAQVERHPEIAAALRGEPKPGGRSIYEQLGALVPREPLTSIRGKLRQISGVSDYTSNTKLQSDRSRDRGDQLRRHGVGDDVIDQLVMMKAFSGGMIPQIEGHPGWRLDPRKILLDDLLSSGYFNQGTAATWRQVDKALEGLPKKMGPLGRAIPTSHYNASPWVANDPHDRHLEGPVRASLTTGVSASRGEIWGGPQVGYKPVTTDFSDPAEWTEAGYKTIHKMLDVRNNARGGPVRADRGTYTGRINRDIVGKPITGWNDPGIGNRTFSPGERQGNPWLPWVNHPLPAGRDDRAGQPLLRPDAKLIRPDTEYAPGVTGQQMDHILRMFGMTGGVKQLRRNAAGGPARPAFLGALVGPLLGGLGRAFAYGAGSSLFGSPDQMASGGAAFRRRGTPKIDVFDLYGAQSHEMKNLLGWENPSYMQGLRESMEQEGLKRPVKVRVMDGRPIIWDGNHRIAAALSMPGWSSLPADIRDVDTGRFVSPGKLGWQKRAAGGPAPHGLYIVNEVGKEGFVTATDAAKGLIPPHVMAQIPKAKDGAKTGMIDRPAWSMFAPERDGWIIPAHLVKEVPALHGARHAAGGRRPSGYSSPDIERLVRAAGAPRVDPSELLRHMQDPTVEREYMRSLEQTIGLSQMGLTGAAGAIPARSSTRSMVGALGIRTIGGGLRHQMNIAQAQQARIEYEETAKQAGQVLSGAPGRKQALSEAQSRLAAIPAERAAAEARRSGATRPADTALQAMRAAGRDKATDAEKTAWKTIRGTLNTSEKTWISANREVMALTREVPRTQRAIANMTKSVEMDVAIEKKLVDAKDAHLKATKKAVAGPIDVAKGMIGGAASMQAYVTLTKAGSFAMGELIKASAPVIDSLMGFGAANTRASRMIGERIVASGGNVEKAFAEIAQSAGIGALGMEFLRKSYEPGATAQAGQMVESQGADLWRGAMQVQTGAPKGLYGGYGGVLGTSFLAQNLGGAAGFAETMAGNLAAGNLAYVTPPAPTQTPFAETEAAGTSELDKYVASTMTSSAGLGPTPGAGDPRREGARVLQSDELASNRQIDAGQKAYMEHLDDLMARTATYEARPGGASFKTDFVGRKGALDPERAQKFLAAAEQTKDAAAISAAKSMVEAGYVVEDSMGNVVDDAQKFEAYWKDATKGASLTDPLTYMRQQAQGFRGQMEGATEQALYALNTRIPAQTGEQLAAQPFLAASAGVLPTEGKAQLGGRKSEIDKLIAETDALQSKLTAAGAEAVKSQADWIDQQAQLDPELNKMAQKMTGLTNAAGESVKFDTAAEAYTGLMDVVSDSGKTIADYQTRIADLQINMAAKSYANNMRLANRAVSDALGLAGRARGAGNLGAVQREQTMLGFSLQQKQINFSVAMAGFQAPGLTSEQRAANQEQAKIEAAYAQKQLNLSKRAFNIEAGRGVTDTTQARSVMKFEWEAQREIAAVTKRIAAEQLKQGQALARANTVLQRAEGTFSGRLGIATSYVSVFGGTIGKATTALRSALGMTAVDPRTGKPIIPAGRKSAPGMLGTFSTPTQATFGEAGSETVAILRNPRVGMLGMGGGGVGGGGSTSFTLNLTVQGDVKDEATVAKITRAVEDMFNRKAARLGMRTYVSATG